LGAEYDYAGSFGNAGGGGTSYGPLTMAYSTVVDPFAFASETQTWATCSSSCTVQIPAYAGRVLYYVIDRKFSNGMVVTGGLQVVTVN